MVSVCGCLRVLGWGRGETIIIMLVVVWGFEIFVSDGWVVGVDW